MKKRHKDSTLKFGKTHQKIQHIEKYQIGYSVCSHEQIWESNHRTKFVPAGSTLKRPQQNCGKCTGQEYCSRYLWIIFQHFECFGLQRSKCCNACAPFISVRPHWICEQKMRTERIFWTSYATVSFRFFWPLHQVLLKFHSGICLKFWLSPVGPPVQHFMWRLEKSEKINKYAVQNLNSGWIFCLHILCVFMEKKRAQALKHLYFCSHMSSKYLKNIYRYLEQSSCFAHFPKFPGHLYNVDSAGTGLFSWFLSQICTLGLAETSIWCFSKCWIYWWILRNFNVQSLWCFWRFKIGCFSEYIQVFSLSYQGLVVQGLKSLHHLLM